MLISKVHRVVLSVLATSLVFVFFSADANAQTIPSSWIAAVLISPETGDVQYGYVEPGPWGHQVYVPQLSGGSNDDLNWGGYLVYYGSSIPQVVDVVAPVLDSNGVQVESNGFDVWMGLLAVVD